MSLFSAHKNPDLPSDPAAGPNRNRPGLTLIELLIVLAISVLVLGAAVTLYQVNARVYVQQDAMLEQNQNLRVGMYTVARDVRMAGNSFPLLGLDITHVQVAVPPDGRWFRYDGSPNYGVRAIFGRDGGPGGPDSLTIFRADVESGSPVGQLAAAVNPDGSQSSLTLQEPFSYNTLRPGNIIALVNGNQAAVLQVSSNPAHFPTDSMTGLTNVIQLGTTRFVPNGSNPSILGFPAGTFVYNLRDITFVTYSVDDNYNLVADYHDSGLTEYDSGRSVIVATNIEDFQVRYIFNGRPIGPLEGDDEIQENKLAANNWVVAVNLAMVSRSAKDDGSVKNHPPKQLFNHQTTGPGDGHQRRVLLETVYLRNFSQ